MYKTAEGMFSKSSLKIAAICFHHKFIMLENHCTSVITDNQKLLSSPNSSYHKPLQEFRGLVHKSISHILNCGDPTEK